MALPAIVFGVPVLAARRTNARLRAAQVRTRNRHILVALTTIAAIIISPLLAGVAISAFSTIKKQLYFYFPVVGVPMLLAYVYGVVPFSLCRQVLDDLLVTSVLIGVICALMAVAGWIWMIVEIGIVII